MLPIRHNSKLRWAKYI